MNDQDGETPTSTKVHAFPTKKATDKVKPAAVLENIPKFQVSVQWDTKLGDNLLIPQHVLDAAFANGCYKVEVDAIEGFVTLHVAENDRGDVTKAAAHLSRVGQIQAAVIRAYTLQQESLEEATDEEEEEEEEEEPEASEPIQLIDLNIHVTVDIRTPKNPPGRTEKGNEKVHNQVRVFDGSFSRVNFIGMTVVDETVIQDLPVIWTFEFCVSQINPREA